jgi:hypothetical protein
MEQEITFIHCRSSQYVFQRSAEREDGAQSITGNRREKMRPQ